MANKSNAFPSITQSQSQHEVTANNEDLAASPAMAFGRDGDHTSGLNFGLLEGVFPVSGTPTFFAAQVIATTDNATNYLYLDSSGTVHKVTSAPSGWPGPLTSSAVALWELTVASGLVTNYLDWRHMFGAAGSGASGSAGGDLAGSYPNPTWTGGTATKSVNWAPTVTIASGSTVAIGAAAGNYIVISGTTTITAFDTIAAGAERIVEFSGALALTHNGSSLILPTGANITTAAGDCAVFMSLGSGNWRCVSYMRASGSALVSSSFTGGTLTSALNEAPTVTIASASTVNIGAAAGNTISVTGTVTITAFDTIAAGAFRRVVFAGILTLTHNGTSLILPTAANITTAAGDVAEFLSLGSGNWRCTSYTRASGSALVGSSFTGGTLTSAINDAPIVTIASSTTPAIGAAAANSIIITGTTTITGFDTIAGGAIRYVEFSGSLVLTYNASSLILPSGNNITTSAGDTAAFLSLGSGNWRCLFYQRATGIAITSSSATSGPYFGPGTDGSAVLDGTNTVTWASKSGSVYTMTAACACTSLTVNSGVTLDVANFPVYVSATLTNNGHIHCDGPAGQAGALGGSGGTGRGAQIYGGSANGAGSTGTTAPSAGTSETSSVCVGSAGNGGTAASGAGSSGGAGTAPATGGVAYCFSLAALQTGSLAGSNSKYTFGSGGGAGRGSTGASGGSGGAGGAMCAIFASVMAGNGSITANGGDAGACNPSAVNGAGGGGGVGGVVAVVTTTATWQSLFTVQANGGALSTGTGTGTNGTAGANGHIISYTV